MKKIIILILSIGVLTGLSVLAYHLMTKEERSDEEMISFKIDDIASIDKVIISNTRGQKLTVIKKGGTWTDDQGHCLMQESLEFMLDAFKNIEFKGYLNNNEKKTFTKIMTASHTKVEIFQNGEWTKTWYIGPNTKDNYGQIMLLDTKDEGKSKFPVIMRIKNMNGIISPRFRADYREWMCQDIFSLKRQQIKEIDVKYIDGSANSFTIKRNGPSFDVLHNGTPLPEVDSSYIYRYLKNYTDLNYSSANYTMSKDEIDKLKASTPFCVLTLTETNGAVNRLRMFRIKIKSKESVDDETIDVYNDSGDTFWCELNDGTVVKCQYYHFDPILKGHLYFPALALEEN